MHRLDLLAASSQSVQQARPHVIAVLKLLGWYKPLLLLQDTLLSFLM